MAERKMSAGRRPTAAEVALAAAAVLVLLALGLGGAGRSRALAVERRTVSDHEALASVASSVALDLERVRDLVAEAALAATVGATELAGREDPPGSQGIHDVEALDGGPVPDPSLPESVQVALRDDAAAVVLARAQDSGDAELAAPVETPDGPRLLFAAAVYGPPGPPGEGDGASVVPTSSIDRRAGLAGWRLAIVDPGRLVAEQLPDGVAASIRDGSTAFPVAGVAVDGDASFARRGVEVRGRRLELRVGDPDRVALTAPTVALALGGVASAALAGVGVLAAGAALRARSAQARRSDEQVEVIGEIAPLVQQSLDLAEVLPTVALQLTDHFGLAGIRLSAGTSSAGQVEIFGLGARPRAASKPVLTPPDELPAGETLTLALQRGGRSVALVQLVAGRALDAQDLQSLRAITELITAAVVNASLYASQQESVRRLRELDRMKTVFLSTASHELRTPATAIGGFASLLSTSWDRFTDEQRQEFAARIAANARSLGAVVQDLLDFSLLDRGRLDVTLVPVDLGELVPALIDRLGPALPDHEVACLVDDRRSPVAGDVNAIERIVTNLLTNAAKFSPVGSTITALVTSTDGGSALVVNDEGPGVPEEERAQIFSRFYRGSGEAVVRTRGVGIGLSVVAELAERMGGSVVIDDAPGGGARFTVTLRSAEVLETKEVADASTA